MEKPRVVCYSVFEETGLILALVLLYSEYLLQTNRERSQCETAIKEPVFAA